MLKVGQINFINPLPFYTAFHKGAVQTEAKLIKGFPGDLNQALAKGTVDLSLISVAEYLRNEENYDLLPQFCIGAIDKVQSVCLYTKRPLDQLDGLDVYLPVESASSTNLCRVLCQHAWKIKPRFKEYSQKKIPIDKEAFVLIGDLPLVHPKIEGFTTIDLATEWHRYSGLPFVFACFAVRKDVHIQKKEEVRDFLKDLNCSYEWATHHFDEVIAYAQENSDLSKETLKEYFTYLNFRLTPPFMSGMKRFAELSQTLSCTLCPS